MPQSKSHPKYMRPMLACPSQPSAEKLKESIAFSEDCLEKMDKYRSEKDFHEVRFCCCVSFLNPLWIQMHKSAPQD